MAPGKTFAHRGTAAPGTGPQRGDSTARGGTGILWRAGAPEFSGAFVDCLEEPLP